MIKQQEQKVKEKKQTKNKEKEIVINNVYFLGKFTLDEYYQKQVNLILEKFK